MSTSRDIDPSAWSPCRGPGLSAVGTPSSCLRREPGDGSASQAVPVRSAVGVLDHRCHVDGRAVALAGSGPSAHRCVTASDLVAPDVRRAHDDRPGTVRPTSPIPTPGDSSPPSLSTSTSQLDALEGNCHQCPALARRPHHSPEAMSVSASPLTRQALLRRGLGVVQRAGAPERGLLDGVRQGACRARRRPRGGSEPWRPGTGRSPPSRRSLTLQQAQHMTTLGLLTTGRRG